MLGDSNNGVISNSNSFIDSNEEYMLTTLDNPFNPFTQFDEWFAFDSSKGYNTCSYLARVARVSNDLSEEELSYALDQAQNEIVEMNILGNYVKVTKDGFKDRSHDLQE